MGMNAMSVPGCAVVAWILRAAIATLRALFSACSEPKGTVGGSSREGMLALVSVPLVIQDFQQGQREHEEQRKREVHGDVSERKQQALLQTWALLPS